MVIQKRLGQLVELAERFLSNVCERLSAGESWKGVWRVRTKSSSDKANEANETSDRNVLAQD